MRWFGNVVFVLLILPQLVLAQASDDFTIRLYPNLDTTPPSNPSVVSTTPVSDTQIDVVWSTATDTVQMGGYTLFRDGVSIATTTLTTYNDTGLTPSTTYAYSVRAFDWQNNYSSTSAAVATTTLKTPPAPTSTPTTTPTSFERSASGRVVLESFSIEAQLTGATFIFTTNRPSRYILRWGRTDTYSGGYVANETFKFSHQTNIVGLEPGTRYEYELIGSSPAGIEMVLKKGSFTTQAPEDVTPPANVRNLTATIDDGDVVLSWDNPSDPDLAAVRVVRSYQFFPSDTQNGALVYQGTAESIRDRDVFSLYRVQYYTVFSIDDNGNVSSGAVVMVSLPYESGVVPEHGLIPDGILPPSIGTALPPPDEPVDDDADAPRTYGGLTPDVITIMQAEEIYTLARPLTLTTRLPYRISIPYEAVPPHLKSIIVSIQGVGGDTGIQQYLLKINHDKTAYETYVEPTEVVGSGTILVSVYDYELAIVSYVQQGLTMSDGGERSLVPEAVVFPDQMGTYSLYGIVALLFVLLLLFLYWFYLGRDDGEEEQTSV